MLLSPVQAQQVVVPINSVPIYSFLDKMELKGLISIKENVRPFTRKEISGYLNTIKKNAATLSSVEKEELTWFEKDYFDEMNPMNKDISKDFFGSFINQSDNRKLRLFYYRDSVFTFSLTPLIQYTTGTLYNKSYFHQKWGFSFYGSISNNFGFRLGFNENTEKGNNIDRNKLFSAERGAILSSNKENSIDFSESTGSFLFSNDWITAGLAKENFTVGNGYRSQVILSSKSPSFPTIFLKLHPVDWFRFYFMHGWLLSGIADSNSAYYTALNALKYTERSKYFVLHELQFIPADNLSFSLGETIIYSDRPFYLGYFIPFLFYRSVDHQFTFGGTDSGNNGSIFWDVSYKPIKSLKIYNSLYIDEFSLTNFLKGNNARTQWGYTLGASYYGIIDNLLTRVEYTKILPWVYSNWIPAQTYTNNNYLLGSYIGQNADQIFVQFEYSLSPKTNFKVWGEYIRRGGFEDIKNQYTMEKSKFLYGLVKVETNIGLEVSYQFFHDIWAKGYIQYSNNTDEDINRTPDYQLGSHNSLGLTLNLGF